MLIAAVLLTQKAPKHSEGLASSLDVKTRVFQGLEIGARRSKAVYLEMQKKYGYWNKSY